MVDVPCNQTKPNQTIVDCFFLNSLWFVPCQQNVEYAAYPLQSGTTPHQKSLRYDFKLHLVMRL